MLLTARQIRVLGCLIEKERTTPDGYPLTTKALATACNQKTSRDPVVNYSAAEVDSTMLELRDLGIARTVKGDGHRSFKHKHVLPDVMRLDDQELAVMAVLMLRGRQSAGELKTRTERYVGFPDLHTVEATLRRLAERPEPLTRNVGRESGQSQDRWIHLVLDPDDPSATDLPPAVASAAVPAPPPPPVAAAPAEVAPERSGAPLVSSASAPTPGRERLAALEAEVAELRALVESLCAELGVDPAALESRPG